MSLPKAGASLYRSLAISAVAQIVAVIVISATISMIQTTIDVIRFVFGYIWLEMPAMMVLAIASFDLQQRVVNRRKSIVVIAIGFLLMVLCLLYPFTVPDLSILVTIALSGSWIVALGAVLGNDPKISRICSTLLYIFILFTLFAYLSICPSPCSNSRILGLMTIVGTWSASIIPVIAPMSRDADC